MIWVGVEKLLVLRVRPPRVNMVLGVRAGAGVVRVVVSFVVEGVLRMMSGGGSVGEGVAVRGGGGIFNPHDLAGSRDVPPRSHGASEGYPFHGEGLVMGTPSVGPGVVEVTDNVVGVIVHGRLNDTSPHTLFGDEYGNRSGGS